jgi:hypothetical protein
LPVGLSLLASSGQITGTPTAIGQSNFTIQVKDAASTPVTATQPLVITVTAAIALDQFGGRSDVSCTNATGFFQPVKISNRWWLCTPAGHGYFFEGIGAWMNGNAPNPNNKYGSANNATLQLQNEGLAWGFNGVGQKTYGGAEPTSPCTGCKKLPEIQTFEIMPRALTNGESYAAAGTVTKNLTFGADNNGAPWYYKPLLDVFDAKMATYFTKYMQASNNGNQFQNYKSNPSVIGFMAGDNDFFLGVGPGPDFDAGSNTEYGGGKNESDLGRIVLATSPLQTFNPTPAQGNVDDTAELYSDPKVYAKTAMASPPTTCSYSTPCSLRDYLAKQYVTISALNAAWGSNYTTFDSSGTNRSQTICAAASWTGTNTTCSDTLANLNASPESVQVTVDGALQAGDCPWFAGGVYGKWCSNFHGSTLAAGTGALGGMAGNTIAATSIINYTTGAVTVNFKSAPAAGPHTITVSYVQNGWPYGTGLMDEDGRNSWTGTNVVCLMPVNGGGPGTDSWACRAGNPGSWTAPNANATLAADIENWIGQFSAEFFSTAQSITHANTNVLFMGTDSIGIWMEPANKNVYKGASGYIDVMFHEGPGWSADESTQTGATTQADFNTALNYVTRYYGDHPIVNFWEANANADSAMAGQGSSGVLTFKTQANRGQGYYNVVNAMLNTPSFNASYQFVGISWWGWQDFSSEKTNWGLKTLKDNAYDGRETVTGSVTCSWPLETLTTCGGEAKSSGDVITGVTSANQLWLLVP